MVAKIKSIRETYLYGTLNNSGYVDKLIKTAFTKGKVLRDEDLLYEVTTINKYYKFPLKKDVMDFYKSGNIRPIVFPKGIEEKIPISIPFILAPINNKIGGYTFIDTYKTYNAKEDSYSIDPKKLYCMLESTYMASIIQEYYPAISRNNVFCTEAPSIFAHMFIRVLNRKYALNVDKRAYTKMLYLAAKFFLVNHLGLDEDSDTVTNYALKVSEAESSMLIDEVDNRMTATHSFQNISTFIRGINANALNISQSLSELVLKDFIVDYVQMYHSSALFALEHLSYFMFLVDSVILGAYLNNQAVLEDIVGKSGAKLYTQLNNYSI